MTEAWTVLSAAVAATRASRTAGLRLSHLLGEEAAVIEEGDADFVRGSAETVRVYRVPGRPETAGRPSRVDLGIFDFFAAHDEPAPGPFAFEHPPLAFWGETAVDDQGRLVRIAWQSRFLYRPRLRVGPFKDQNGWTIIALTYR